MAMALGGSRTDVAGSFPKVGDTAPDFRINKGPVDSGTAVCLPD